MDKMVVTAKTCTQSDVYFAREYSGYSRPLVHHHFVWTLRKLSLSFNRTLQSRVPSIPLLLPGIRRGERRPCLRYAFDLLILCTAVARELHSSGQAHCGGMTTARAVFGLLKHRLTRCAFFSMSLLDREPRHLTFQPPKPISRRESGAILWKDYTTQLILYALTACSRPSNLFLPFRAGTRRKKRYLVKINKHHERYESFRIERTNG